MIIEIRFGQKERKAADMIIKFSAALMENWNTEDIPKEHDGLQGYVVKGYVKKKWGDDSVPNLSRVQRKAGSRRALRLYRKSRPGVGAPGRQNGIGYDEPRFHIHSTGFPGGMQE